MDATNATNNGYNNNSTLFPDYLPKLIGDAALAVVGGLAVAGGIVFF